MAGPDHKHKKGKKNSAKKAPLWEENAPSSSSTLTFTVPSSSSSATILPSDLSSTQVPAASTTGEGHMAFQVSGSNLVAADGMSPMVTKVHKHPYRLDAWGVVDMPKATGLPQPTLPMPSPFTTDRHVGPAQHDVDYPERRFVIIDGNPEPITNPPATHPADSASVIPSYSTTHFDVLTRNHHRSLTFTALPHQDGARAQSPLRPISTTTTVRKPPANSSQLGLPKPRMTIFHSQSGL